jgi:hypothetical protein
MLAEADLEGLVRHADHHQADAGPSVEQRVHQFELGRVSLDEYGGQRDTEATASGV